MNKITRDKLTREVYLSKKREVNYSYCSKPKTRAFYGYLWNSSYKEILQREQKRYNRITKEVNQSWYRMLQIEQERAKKIERIYYDYFDLHVYSSNIRANKGYRTWNKFGKSSKSKELLPRASKDYDLKMIDKIYGTDKRALIFSKELNFYMVLPKSKFKDTQISKNGLPVFRIKLAHTPLNLIKIVPKKRGKKS